MISILKAINTAQNRFLVIVMGLGLIVLLVGSRTILKADFEKLSNLKKETEMESKKGSILKRIADLENKMNKDYGSFVVKTNETSWLIEAISKMAKESEITLTSVAPQGAQATEDYEKISLNLETECGYHQLGEFVSRIENFSPVMKIRNLNITKPMDGGPAKKTLNVSMSVCIFHPVGQLKDILA